MINIAIVGSRNYVDKEFIYKQLDKFIGLLGIKDICIVSGGARGVDTIAREYSTDKGYALKEFNADWDKFGKVAGFIRNGDIINYANVVFAFWDGVSSGTKDSIEKSKKEDKHLIVYKNRDRVL